MNLTAASPSVPQRWKSIPTALADRAWAMMRPKIARLVYTNGGIGDELMLTAIAREARRAGKPLHILTNLPALWAGNPDPASVQTDVERWFYALRRGWIDTEISHLPYQNGNGRHIATQMADRAGVALPPDWRPIFAHTPTAHRNSRRIVVQNSCRGARYAATTKEWPQDRWELLAANLARDLELVQLGTPADPQLPHAEDLRGRTSLRQATELLAGAACFLGLESGLMHVAAAASTPAIIIYGGRTRPHETGYPFHVHVTRAPACAGCGLNDGCPHARMCLDIPVTEVEAAVRAVVERS